MTPAILILTVLTSAIAAGAATYFLNVSKERLFFVGQKSEELYRTIEGLDFELSSFYSRCYSLLGEMRRPASNEHLHRANSYLATARMLVGLYFPLLASQLARVGAASVTAHRALETLEGAAEAERGHLVEALDASVCDLKDGLDALKTAVLAIGHNANRRTFFALSWRSIAAARERRVLQVHP